MLRTEKVSKQFYSQPFSELQWIKISDSLRFILCLAILYISVLSNHHTHIFHWFILLSFRYGHQSLINPLNTTQTAQTVWNEVLHEWREQAYSGHAEVEFGLLRTLQDELEAALALIGHAALIIALQDPLLLGGKYRPQVHLQDRRTPCKEMK